MTHEQAKDLALYVGALFTEKSATVERLRVLRDRFERCGLDPAVVRELITQHRETEEYLSEPRLLASIRRHGHVPYQEREAREQSGESREQRLIKAKELEAIAKALERLTDDELRRHRDEIVAGYEGIVRACLANADPKTDGRLRNLIYGRLLSAGRAS